MIIAGFVVLGILLVILQTTVFMIDPTWNASPDLYFILVGYLGYRMDILRAVIILFPVSCVLDVLSGVVLGMYPSICFSSFFLLRIVSRKLPVRESLYHVPLLAACYLFVHWVVFIVFGFIRPDLNIAWSWPAMLLRAALVAAFTVPLFRLFSWLEKALRKRLVPVKWVSGRSENRYR